MELNGIQRITYNFVNNTEAKEECGTRYPMYLVEGIYGCVGTIERYYTGSTMWASYIRGLYGGDAAIPIITLQIYPGGSGSSRHFIQIDDIKLDKISVSQRPGSSLMIETWDFVSTGSVTFGTTGA